jgi:hypothetical protein
VKPGLRRTVLAWALAAAGAAAPGVGAAACATPGDPRAAAVALDDPKVAASLLVQLGVWTRIMVSKDLAGELRQRTRGCERVRFATARGAYTLRGEDEAGGLPRVATPETKGGPMGYLTVVPDLQTAMTPGHAGAAPALGYALQTRDGDTHTTWRIYTAIPTDDVLARDVAAALAGELRPALRVRGDQVQIIVPKS